MPTLNGIKFEAFCATCGSGICENVEVRDDEIPREGNDFAPRLVLEPCAECRESFIAQGLHANCEQLEQQIEALRAELARPLSLERIVRGLARLIDADEPPGLAAATLSGELVALVKNREAPTAIVLEVELRRLAARYPRNGFEATD